MKKILIFLCLVVPELFSMLPTCRTTFIITDCSGATVAGASVTIQKCGDSKQLSALTDSKGKAVFAICKSDICRTKITFVGFSPKQVTGAGSNCSGDDSNTICNIKVCDQSN